MQTRRWLPKFAWVLLGLGSCQTSKGEELNQHSAQESDVPAVEAGADTIDSNSTEPDGNSTEPDSDSAETSSDDTSTPTAAPTVGSCSFDSDAADGGSVSIRPRPLNCDLHHDSLPEPTQAAVDRYSCFDANLPGYETVYSIEPQVDGPLSGFIDPTPGVEIVLLLLDENCDPAHCLSSVTIEEYGDWTINDTVLEAGKRYHLVVEGGSPSRAPLYAISYNCE